ncbi:MAG TPA: arginine--tRNA ligase, partial [Candidatus Babeliales bacterium]|nr:arginine--tRNA ligase [Candidatus Babeliales bacterium]
QKLGQSFKIRCQQALGQTVALPEAAYHGDYLPALAQACIAEFGAAILEQSDQFFADYAKAHLLVAIQQTLQEYGVHFDVWFSELDLHQSGAILAVLERLQQAGYTYEQDQATWFKSTQFGDDKDRVVRKSDGELTYVAADIAYLKNKVTRGATHLVMVLGQDHHSYATRLQGLKQALGLTTPLDIIIYQLVSMQSSGEAVRMSKRAGNIVTLRGVIDTVGTDVARFFYLNRKADSQLEFNLDLALTKTEANPVYYIQYALVRIKSILRKAHSVLAPNLELACADEAQPADNTSDYVPASSAAQAITEAEFGVILKICELKQILAAIERTQQTHLLTYYALELARLFHHYYSQHQVLDATQPALSQARLLVLAQLEQTLALTLELMGLSRPERM